MDIIGYFVDKKDKLESNTVMVAIQKTRKGKIETYCPIGQHFEADELYIYECCRKITKEEYKEASKLFHTPMEYL